MSFFRSQNGNVFFALFGAVAFVGVLGAATMSFMKGPLQTSVTLSRMSVANTQMQVAAQMAVLQASTQSDFGDCDSDGFVEPIEFKTQANVNLKPTNGGNIPNTLGATKKDPWGRLYGYCVWNSGTNITIDSVGACDNDSSGAEQRIEGSNNNFDTVLAIISSGADRSFQTTCLDFATADVNGNGLLGDVGDDEMVAKASGSDDIILAYTYAEANINGAGLWSIKSSDPGTAIIEKAIEFSGGLSMGTSTDVTICNPSSANVMRYNPFNSTIEVCDGIATWNPIGKKIWKDDGPDGPAEIYYTGGNIGIGTNDPTTALQVNGSLRVGDGGETCDGSVEGSVRYDTAAKVFEGCDGVSWKELVSSPCDQLPTAFEFIDIPDATTSNLVSSDIVQITGLDDLGCNVDVSISGGGVPQYRICNNSSCGSVVIDWTAGITNMDMQNKYIQLRTTSSASVLTTNTVTVYIGPQSDKWYVTTDDPSDPCAVVGIGDEGTVCADGSLYAGDSPAGGALFVPRCVSGRTWNGAICTGVRTKYPWNDGIGWKDTSLVNCFNYLSCDIDGEANTNTLITEDGNSSMVGIQMHIASQYCADLIMHGRNDWFLPSIRELEVVYNNRVAIGDFVVSGGTASRYWSSSEANSWPSQRSWAIRFENGSIEHWDQGKHWSLPLRCVRKN